MAAAGAGEAAEEAQRAATRDAPTARGASSVDAKAALVTAGLIPSGSYPSGAGGSGSGGRVERRRGDLT